MNKAVIQVQAPREHVFATLTKYEEYPLWVPGCRRLNVVASSGNQTDVEIVQAAMKTITALLRFQADPPAAVRFEMIKGTDFKAYSGQHRLMVAAGGGTVVTTEIEMDAGFMMPRFLLDDKVRQFLEEFGKGLRKRVAAAGTPPGAVSTLPPGARRRTRRLLRITRTAAGMRIWYLGKILTAPEETEG
jgi:carbon monoxide dehydrogenase subunit G